MNKALLKLQADYMELHKNKWDIFPLYWFEVDNDSLKIKVLERAIKANDLIINVEGGNEFIEEVK